MAYKQQANITVIFDNLGPYHLARLTALAKLCDLTALEMRERSKEYGWAPTADAAFRRETLETPTTGELCRQLDRAAPQVVFIPGWSSPAALAALGWCRRRGVPGIVMSDSQRGDFQRRRWRELGKGWIVRNIALCVAFLNFGEASFFSPGGMGLITIIVFGLAVTVPRRALPG